MQRYSQQFAYAKKRPVFNIRSRSFLSVEVFVFSTGSVVSVGDCRTALRRINGVLRAYYVIRAYLIINHPAPISASAACAWIYIGAQNGAL